VADDAGFPTVTDEQLAAGKVFGPTVDLDRVRREARDDPEPDPIGAAFERIRQGAPVGPGITFLDDTGRTVQALDHTGSPEPMRPQDQLPPFRPPVREDPAAPLRTVQVRATGDDEVDAMLMLRAIMDQQPAGRHRRLLEYLADRYA
jgi:hypothetical protein